MNVVLVIYCVIFVFIGLLVDVIRINVNDLGIVFFKFMIF